MIKDTPDYYEVLGVPKDASYPEIKAAYRSFALELHPDRNQGASETIRELAKERFRLINEANAVLSNSTKRKKYDTQREQEKVNSERTRIQERIQSELNAGNLKDAVDIARSLYEAHPHDPECQEIYAELLYDLGCKHAENGDTAEAIRIFKLAAGVTKNDEFKHKINGELELLAMRARSAKTAAQDKTGKTISASTGHIFSKTWSSLSISGLSDEPVWPFGYAGLGTLLFGLTLVWSLVAIAVWIVLGIILNLLMALGNSLTDFSIAFGWSKAVGGVVSILGFFGNFVFLLSQRNTWKRIGRQVIIIILVITTLGIASMLGKLLGFLAKPSGPSEQMITSPTPSTSHVKGTVDLPSEEIQHSYKAKPSGSSEQMITSPIPSTSHVKGTVDLPSEEIQHSYK